jgi:hypothetical protein
VKLRYWIGAFCAVAVVCGILAAQEICASSYCRSKLGTFFGRGALVALVNGCRIYEGDIARATQALRDRSGTDTFDGPGVRELILQSLTANCALARLSQDQEIQPNEILRQYDNVRAEIQPETAWVSLLRRNNFSTGTLRTILSNNLRATNWIERHINARIQVSAEECREYYESHQTAYYQPMRLRVRHLFLAAPAGTSVEIAEDKRRAMNNLRDRLNNGEDFSSLVAVFSEDEMTKTHGGDLGFLSDRRMPADFVSLVKGMRVGDGAQLIRTHLGFHLVQVLDIQAPAQMSFDQAWAEITQMVANDKRAAAVEALTSSLSGQASFVAGLSAPK